jgi:hypothetical protein
MMIKRINQWLVIRQAQITFKPDNIDRLFVAVEHGDKGLKMDESVYTLLLVSWITSLVIFMQLLVSLNGKTSTAKFEITSSSAEESINIKSTVVGNGKYIGACG